MPHNEQLSMLGVGAGFLVAAALFRKRRSQSTAGSKQEQWHGQPENVCNPHLQGLSKDVLYHLGLTTGDDLKSMLGGVRYFLMGGTKCMLMESSSSASDYACKTMLVCIFFQAPQVV
jgi:hypothetical protein